MNYLFDGCSQTVLELAHLSKYSNSDDEFRVYAPESYPIKDTNISSLTFAMNTDIDEYSPNRTGTYVAIPDGMESVKTDYISTVDFNQSLDWCDVYVLDSSWREAEHIDMARKAGKKVICLHKPYSFTDNTNREDFEELKRNLSNKTLDKKPQITFVTSSFNGYSNKLEAAVELSRFRISSKEKVAILSCEAQASLLRKNNLGIPVYSYNRACSDFTIDEEIEYLNLMIHSISLQTMCDRIFVIGQSRLGIADSFNSELKPLKSRSLFDMVFMHTIGADSVVLVANPDSVPSIQCISSYMVLSGVPVDCIYMSQIKGTLKLKITDMNEAMCPDVYSRDRVWNAMMHLKGELPYIFIYTDYLDIQKDFDRWCADPDGLSDYASKNLVYSFISALSSQKDVQSKGYVTGDLTHQITQVLAEEKHKLKKLDKKVLKEIQIKLSQSNL